MELRDIVEQAKSGDRAAFDRLVEAYRDMAMGYARTLVRNEEAAEDAVQEAWVVAQRNLDGLIDSAAFLAWLRGIVKRRCLQNIERRSPVPLGNLDASSSGEDLERWLIDRSSRDHVRAAVNNLAKDQLQAVRLHYEDALSHTQIAAKLGISKETVNMRLHAARARLRRRLISMNEIESHSVRVGRVVGTDGVLITLQFQPDNTPLLVSRLESEGSNLCVVRRLPAGQVQAVPASEGGIWTPGREVCDTGEPFKAPLTNSIICRTVHGTGDAKALLPTGIKTIDLFAPLAQGGSVGLFAEWGVGILVLLPELVRRLDISGNRQTIFSFVPPLRNEKEWREVNAEITPGSLRMEVFYLPVEDSISKAFVEAVGPLDSNLVLSRRLAEQGIWPSVDPLRSSSRILLADRAAIAEEVCKLLRRYYQLQFSMDSELERGLTQEEWLAVRRARLAVRFLSQPFFVAEPYTGVPGVDADTVTTAQTFNGILEGQFDSYGKEAFMMAGAKPKEAK